MAVAYWNLLRPKGRIHPDLFPDRMGHSLLEDVTAWIDSAYADARVAALPEGNARDAAATAYAYWRVFDAAVIAMAANPATSAQTDAGTVTYTKDQRDTFARLAAEARAEFEVAVAAPVTPYLGGGTRTVYHTFG